jgi:hypothetical protein
MGHIVPDYLIGNDPERVKSELTSAFDRLLALDFDTLLFAHGDPLIERTYRPTCTLGRRGAGVGVYPRAPRAGDGEQGGDILGREQATAAIRVRVSVRPERGWRGRPSRPHGCLRPPQ